MQILLRETIDHLGSRGDVVKVADGYARNYLIPKRLATLVTEGNKRQLETERRNYEKKVMAKKSVAEEAKGRLEQVSLKIAKKSGESNQLFGSVTSHEIAELLLEKGFEVDRRKLDVPHIKELGSYTIQAKLHVEVTAEFQCEVVAES